MTNFEGFHVKLKFHQTLESNRNFQDFFAIVFMPTVFFALFRYKRVKQAQNIFIFFGNILHRNQHIVYYFYYELCYFEVIFGLFCVIFKHIKVRKNYCPILLNNLRSSFIYPLTFKERQIHVLEWSIRYYWTFCKNI